MGQGTGTRTRWARRWRGRGQKWRMASRVVADEGMNGGSVDPQMTGRAPDQRQQRSRWWGTKALADAGSTAGQQGEGQGCKPVGLPDTRGYARRVERQWRSQGPRRGPE